MSSSSMRNAWTFGFNYNDFSTSSNHVPTRTKLEGSPMNIDSQFSDMSLSQTSNMDISQEDPFSSRNCQNKTFNPFSAYYNPPSRPANPSAPVNRPTPGRNIFQPEDTPLLTKRKGHTFRPDDNKRRKINPEQPKPQTNSTEASKISPNHIASRNAKDIARACRRRAKKKIKERRENRKKSPSRRASTKRGASPVLQKRNSRKRRKLRNRSLFSTFSFGFSDQNKNENESSQNNEIKEEESSTSDNIHLNTNTAEKGNSQSSNLPSSQSSNPPSSEKSEADSNECTYNNNHDFKEKETFPSFVKRPSSEYRFSRQKSSPSSHAQENTENLQEDSFTGAGGIPHRSRTNKFDSKQDSVTKRPSSSYSFTGQDVFGRKERFQSSKRKSEVYSYTKEQLPEEISSSQKRREKVDRKARKRISEMKQAKKEEEEQNRRKEKLVKLEQRKTDKIRRAFMCDGRGLLRYLCPEFEVPRTPTLKQMERFYRKSLQKYHPDRNRNASLEKQVEAEERFKIIGDFKPVILGLATGRRRF